MCIIEYMLYVCMSVCMYVQCLLHDMRKVGLPYICINTIVTIIAIFLVLSESSYEEPCMLSQHYGIMYVSQGEMT